MINAKEYSLFFNGERKKNKQIKGLKQMNLNDERNNNTMFVWKRIREKKGTLVDFLSW